ncbi:hypothetical protein L873DRAFT_1801134 [Choiromyces venosus 120613-1]|uniref:Uncharacterized protein n=1 Tax=Choiromyces venosus 120613-1 TaxID=1336337 RepID=A0A3N4K152_9PEZI|nr:hypothetical protein L873DRAFT_1801134 [Choiromyces venosus 120613-1]
MKYQQHRNPFEVLTFLIVNVGLLDVGQFLGAFAEGVCFLFYFTELVYVRKYTGTSVLVPYTVALNRANGVSGYGSFCLMANKDRSLPPHAL